MYKKEKKYAKKKETKLCSSENTTTG